MPRSGSGDGTFLRRWVRATFAGWVLGVPFIIVLALAGELLGISGAQVLVGAGMGAGVGLLQARALRPVLGRSTPWFWSCVGGLAAPFLVADIAMARGWSFSYSLHASVALGGLAAGAWQALILHRRFTHTTWWVAASTLGWALGGGTASVADLAVRGQQLRGLPGLLAYLGVVALGGLILGVVTGVPLAWILARNREAARAASERTTAGAT